MKYEFIVASKVTAEADYQKGTSKMVACDVQLFEPDGTANLRDDNGLVNKEGMKIQTQGLIQGLIANIHFAHQNNMWDSAEHLRYVIQYLEKGFIQSNTKATSGNFFKKH